MPQVKIILVQTIDCDYYSKQIVRDSITDWEEVTEEEFTLLRDNLRSVVTIGREHYDYEPMLIVKDDKPVVEHIKTIREAIEQQRAKREAEAERRRQKKLEKDMKMALEKAESERALLAALKEKYES